MVPFVCKCGQRSCSLYFVGRNRNFYVLTITMFFWFLSPQNAVNFDLEANVNKLSINADISASDGTPTEEIAAEQSSGEDKHDEVFGQGSPQRSPEEKKVRSQSLLEHMDSNDRQQVEEGE